MNRWNLLFENIGKNYKQLTEKKKFKSVKATTFSREFLIDNSKMRGIINRTSDEKKIKLKFAFH